MIEDEDNDQDMEDAEEVGTGAGEGEDEGEDGNEGNVGEGEGAGGDEDIEDEEGEGEGDDGQRDGTGDETDDVTFIQPSKASLSTHFIFQMGDEDPDEVVLTSKRKNSGAPGTPKARRGKTLLSSFTPHSRKIATLGHIGLRVSVATEDAFPAVRSRDELMWRIILEQTKGSKMIGARLDQQDKTDLQARLFDYVRNSSLNIYHH